MSKLLHILCQNLCALSHGFVAEEHASRWQHSPSSGRLSTGRGAEIEHNYRSVDILLKHLRNKHRRGFLDVIHAGVEQRVERKVGAL